MENRHPKADCQNCPLFNDRTSPVPTSGPEDATIAVVGEAPQEREVGIGRPWLGTSGRLLDATLKQAGFDLDKVRYSNAVLCHTENDENGKPKSAPKAAIKACAPRLADEVGNATSVLLAGNAANLSLTPERKMGITKLRKQPPVRSSTGSWIVATINPGAALRNPDSYPSFVKDVRKAMLLSENPDENLFVSWEPPKWDFAEDEEKSVRMLKFLINSRNPYLTVDIEADIEKDVSYEHPRELLSVAVSWAPGKAFVFGTEALKIQKVRDGISYLLDRKQIICQNGKYDLQVLKRMGFTFEPKLYADTMYASYVMDERPGHHGLKALASEWNGTPDYEAEIKEYTGGGLSYAHIPRKLLYKYNAYDAVETWNLWHTLEKELTPELRRLHDDLCEIAIQGLLYVEFEGVRVDIPYLDKLTEEYEDLIVKSDEALKPWVENPRSVPQVKAVLEDLGFSNHTTAAAHIQSLLKVPETLNEQQYQEFLDLHMGSAYEGEREQFLAYLLHSRKIGKLYGTYIKGTRTKMIDGRVYPKFSAHGTVTGRLTCNRPNMQNIPRGSGIKQLFIPNEGNVFVQCDYAQAELRTIAGLAQDKYLQAVFSDPTRDIHGELADVLFGKGNWTKEQRVRAKEYVFGSIYGLTPWTIAKSYGIPEIQASREQGQFFRMIPHTMKWRQGIMNRVMKEQRSLVNPFHRQRRFGLVSNDLKRKLEKEALAFMPQSTANDICLRALVDLRKEFGWSDSPDTPKIRNTVHDSIVIECPEEHKVDVANVAIKIMSEAANTHFTDFVPFNVDAEYGTSLGALEEL